MSSEVSPNFGPRLVRDSRRAGRAISRVQSRGQVRQAEIDVETDVALNRADSLTHTTAPAMVGVARITQAEQQLAQSVPLASGRHGPPGRPPCPADG